MEVMKHLQQKAEDNIIPEFDFVEINGMKLTDPNQAYSILWESMHKSSDTKKYTSTHALQLLESMFAHHKGGNQRTT